MQKAQIKDRPVSDQDELRQMAQSVGDFIRYWGFRRIHGQIWAVLFLTNKDYSGVELTHILGVSKALVSPGLSELAEHGLIVPAGGDGKTKTYRACDDVFKVIRNVLDGRERVLIEKAKEQMLSLQAAKAHQSQPIDDNKLHELKEMIGSASTTLQMIMHLLPR